MAKKAEQTETAAAVAEEQEGDLLSTILSQGRLALDDYQKEQAKDMLGEFVSQVMAGELVMSKDMESAINARIAAIDRLVSAQLNEVMHHEDFQKLEGSWLGLHYLVMNSETSTMLKIRVMNANKKELLKDLEKAVEFDQSATFKKIYEEEFGTFGGAPFGALIGDYEFSNNPQDMDLLEKMSLVVAAAHAPCLTAASSGLFGWDEFSNLTEVRDLAKIFDRAE